MCQLKIRRVSGDWFTVKINDNLFIDLATSRFDKRDRIISKRTDVFLEQDGGFMYSYSKKAYTLTELKAELLAMAQEIALSLVDVPQSLKNAIADDTFPPQVKNSAVSK